MTSWFKIGTGTSAHARDKDEPVAECGARPRRRYGRQWSPAKESDPRCASCVYALTGVRKTKPGPKTKPRSKWGRVGLPVVDEEVVPSVHLIPVWPGEPVHTPGRECWCEPEPVRGEDMVVRHFRRGR
jgi:hypothetical protein